ncbi:hypothetical protein [Enterococcus sp. DIV1059_2]|uniref:hypothetical protein n=1 Tax=Enterococcus sp. DIV1059_2 TaxID=2774664 RepID=UPI003F29F5A3
MVKIMDKEELVSLKVSQGEAVVTAEPVLEKKATVLHVIGDSNNCVNEVRYLLARKNEGYQEVDMSQYGIVFLGNYFSGDPGFVEMAKYMLLLRSSDRKTIFLRGYNETLIVKYLLQEKLNDSEVDDTMELVDSISRQLGYPLENLQEMNLPLYNLFLETRLWYDNYNFIFCPASINLDAAWKTTSVDRFFLDEQDMSNKKNHTGKVIVFGHYASSELNRSIGLKQRKHDVAFWQSNDQTKICLNGEPASPGSGKVLGMFIHNEETHPLSSRVGRKKPIVDEI